MAERFPRAARPSADQQRHAAFADAIGERREQLAGALGRLSLRAAALADIAARLLTTLRGGGKVLVAGNGGSAAAAQHFAAELVGRFRRERGPFAAIALTADTATLTAIANDYGYAEVFARQILAFGRPGDLVVLFSTSGESENLLRAVAASKERGLATIALTGDRPNRLARSSDLAVRFPATDTALVQELHQIATHLLCDTVEAELASSDPAVAPPVGPLGAEPARAIASDHD